MTRAPLAIDTRKCEACGFLYHPSGTYQKFCVRPSCIEQRGKRVDDYLEQEEPRAHPGRTLSAATIRERLQSAEEDLAILLSRPGTDRDRKRVRERIKRYRARLGE